MDIKLLYTRSCKRFCHFQINLIYMQMSNNTSNRLNLATRPIKQLDVNLIEAQTKSFHNFLSEGISDLLDEINPIIDYTGGTNWELHFENTELGEVKKSFIECQQLGLSYEQPVFANVKLVNKKSGEIKKQRVFLADFPLMGERGTFMVNGNERVVVLQILRSEGVLFTEAKASKPTKRLYAVKLMPIRGKWFDFEINKYGVLSVKLLDKHPKILLTTLLRALGYSSNDEIKKLLDGVDTGEESFVEKTLSKDPTRNTEEALIEIYRKLRPEDSLTVENAKEFINTMFFDKRRFYLGRVGRYKLNQKLGLSADGEAINKDGFTLQKRDIVEIVKCVIRLNNGTMEKDDVDSLTNRRIRGVGELIGERVRMGLMRMEKNIRDKMATYSTDELIAPSQLINTRPVIAAISQFFNSSALSRYMEQQNVFSELETKRRITSGGPKGLTKERATFSVRDVHNSHYSKICPVNTPEGPSVGMVTQMAVYSRINDYGFLEAPYNKVVSSLDVNKDEARIEDYKANKRTLLIDVLDEKGKKIASAGDAITKELFAAAKKAGIEKLPVRPFITDDVVFLDADEELDHKIASSSSTVDEFGNILDNQIYVRVAKGYAKVSVREVDFSDVSPAQIASLGFALLPFSMNDDPNRTLIGAKTQNQAVPLLKKEAPIIGTGFEKLAINATGRMQFAEGDGVVVESDADHVIVEYKDGSKKYQKHYHIDKFIRTNQNTSFSQEVAVKVGDKVKEGDIVVNAPCSIDGELALGVNLVTAYLVMDGMNYEDGIVLSERVVKDNLLTSIHIHEYAQDVRETKLGNELITRDIPNVGEHVLRHLDEEGIVRIGAHVMPRDILVGIIAPKGETELSAEEKLLRAIFGDYARDVRDNSLRIPYGEHGIVIGVQILDKAKGDKLDPGVLKRVKVWVATTHNISVGDKLTGFHGDKGIVTKVLPVEDMPYMEDGTPVDIVFGPASMVRRMNLGQLKEAHLGRIANKLGIKLAAPPFAPIDEEKVLELARKENVDISEKVTLYDGRSGKAFDRPVTVGMRYILKLDHLVDHKIHARSTGPYALVTQQPLGGKAQRGGQRFGEMEVWALEAHAVPTVLHEMLTIKSDDVIGRAAAYKAIITGTEITSPTIPESFNVLLRELMALGIKLEGDNTRLDEMIRTGQESIEEIVDTIDKQEIVADEEINAI